MQTQQRTDVRRIVAAAASAAVLLAVLPAVARADVTFKAPVAYATPAGGQDVAVGDFNKDGKLDLATANQGDSSFSILLGNGDGTFQTATTFTVAAGAPKRVAVGDFDHDGKEDLALAINGLSRVAVYWGTGTGAGFDGTNTVVSTPGNPGGVGAADLGFGYDQLLATNPAGTQLSVYTGDPLQRLFGAPVNTAVGNGPDAVASGNLYGETDVVTSFPSSGSVRFERSNGAGGLQSGQGGSYGVGSPPINQGNPTDVAVADVTGDGKGDMLTSNIGTNTATILPSRPANITAQQNTTLPTGAAPTGIAAGDFTGDGTDDAVVVDSGLDEVTVLQGGAPGALQPMTIVGSYPAGSGIQRAEAGDFNGDGAADLAVSSTSNGGEVHVLMSRGAPTLAGDASGSVPVGDNLTDTATLAGATPNAKGTITFLLYGPSDTTCSSAEQVFVAIVTGNRAYTTNPPIPADSAGTYRWVASYSGDANNAAVVGTCSDANQTTVVSKKTTSVTVSPTALITVGASATSQATLSGGVHPTGTIVVRAYATSDCSGSPAYTSSDVPVSGNGTSSVSPAFTPSAAGTYRWRATYSGDGDNESATSTCAASGSTTTVGKQTPTLSASASSPVTVGTTSTVSATLASGYSPTGTVTFAAYTASDCTGGPAWTSTASVSGNGSTTPATPFVPTSTGTYRVVAAYGGDGNNQTAASACAESGTVVTVEQATPTLSLDVPPGVALGAADPAQATLAGLVTGSGTVTFTAYATADCSGTPAYSGGPSTVDGDGDYDAAPPFVPDHAGTYRWIAAYSGDANNAAVATHCGDPGTVTTVAPFAPTLDATATSGTLGTAVHDTATLAGATSDAGGTVVFTAYANATCAGPPAFTSDPVAVHGPGEYGSGPFVPGATGQYRWVATYSGDNDNAPVATDCGAAGQTSTVTQAGLAVDPPSADLGSVQTRHASAPRTITVTNTSAGVTAEAAKIGTVSASGAGFAVVADGCSGRTVEPGASCRFAVTFAPRAAGAASGAVAVPSNAGGSPAKVGLRGTGTSVSLTGLSVTRCLGTAKGAKRRVAVGYRVSAPSNVTFTLQRRVPPPSGVRSTCPKALPPGVPGDYETVLGKVGATRAVAARGGRRALTTTVAVSAGKHTFALSSLLGSTTLKPGRFRVLVQVVSDRGAKAQNAAYFWVLRPRT